MKKHLAWLLALITVIALLVACTTGGDTDTTTENTTASEENTTLPADSDDTTADTTDTTEETTAAPETEAKLPADGFAMDHERIERQLTGGNAMTAAVNLRKRKAPAPSQGSRGLCLFAVCQRGLECGQ